MKRKASNASSKHRSSALRVPVTVRLPVDVIERIDSELGDRDVPVSRNNWLLEAVIEKLRRSASGGPHGTK